MDPVVFVPGLTADSLELDWELLNAVPEVNRLQSLVVWVASMIS